MEEIVRARVAEGRSVGIAAGLVDRSGVRSIAAAGDAGDGQLPLDASSVFEIGSVEKVFTGTLLAEMVGRGEVALNDPVSGFLPQSVKVPSWRGGSIRLLDLATHTSGLPRLPTNLTMSDPANPLADYTTEQLYAFLSSYTLTHPVGSDYQYSNVGFGLLGHALARAARTTYAGLLRDRVLAPLGLASTSFSLTPATARGFALPHDEYGEIVPRWQNPTLVGTGGLLSTLADMLTFAAAQLEPASDPLRRAMAVARAPRHTRADGVRVGLGWHARRLHNRFLLWISGETGGSRSFLGLDQGWRAAVLLTNSASSVDDLGFHLLDHRLELNRDDGPKIKLDPAMLRRYVGVYDLTPEIKVTVTESPAGLSAQATGIGRAPIHPQSETTFFIQPIKATLTFKLDSSGNATGVVFHYRGEGIHGKKIA